MKHALAVVAGVAVLAGTFAGLPVQAGESSDGSLSVVQSIRQRVSEIREQLDQERAERAKSESQSRAALKEVQQERDALKARLKAFAAERDKALKRGEGLSKDLEIARAEGQRLDKALGESDSRGKSLARQMAKTEKALKQELSAAKSAAGKQAAGDEKARASLAGRLSDLESALTAEKKLQAKTASEGADVLARLQANKVAVEKRAAAEAKSAAEALLVRSKELDAMKATLASTRKAQQEVANALDATRKQLASLTKDSGAKIAKLEGRSAALNAKIAQDARSYEASLADARARANVERKTLETARAKAERQTAEMDKELRSIRNSLEGLSAALDQSKLPSAQMAAAAN